MLITFRSKAWANVTMFGDVALTLIRLMGHSGTVPSALLAKDIPAALENLKRGLAATPAPPPARQDDPDAEPPIALDKRAYPLIQLLDASAKQGADVMWDKGVPLP